MRCKPGDLAIVIRATPRYADTIGRCVEVIEWVPQLRMWHVEFTGLLPASLARWGDGALQCFSDPCLLPVSGLPDDIAVKTSTPVEQTA